MNPFKTSLLGEIKFLLELGLGLPSYSQVIRSMMNMSTEMINQVMCVN